MAWLWLKLGIFLLADWLIPEVGGRDWKIRRLALWVRLRQLATFAREGHRHV